MGLRNFDPMYGRIKTGGGYRDMAGLMQVMQTRNFRKSYKKELYTYDDDIREEIQNDFNQYSEEMQKKTQRLTIQVLFLNYVFFNEDSKLSFNEKRLVKRYFKKDKKRIFTRQYISVLNVSKSVKTIDEIINYIKDFNLDYEDVNQSFESVKQLCEHERYSSTIGFLSRKIDTLFH